jgi:outer membrane protein TolC
MGNPLDTQLEPLDLPGALRFDDQPAMSEGMVDRAIESRPDLASARLRKEMARSAASAVKGGWYPSVALAAAYEYSNPNQRIIPPNDRFDGSWEVGVTFQWTVWDWMTTASQSAQAEAVHRQSEAGYELMMEGVKLEVAQLTLQLRDAGQKVESARFAVAAAEESFRVTEEQFSKGLATSVDLTDARVELLRAKLAFTQAVTEAAVTRAELRRAVGEGV